MSKLDKHERRVLKHMMEKERREEESKTKSGGKAKWLGLAILAILIVSVGYVATTGLTVADDPDKSELVTSLDKFAQCLADNGAKMYGAYWCPHCANQKADFGDSFKFVDYVECDPRGENPRVQMCYDAGIQGYPTWEINGLQYPGEQSLQELSKLTGCEL